MKHAKAKAAHHTGIMIHVLGALFLMYLAVEHVARHVIHH